VIGNNNNALKMVRLLLVSKYLVVVERARGPFRRLMRQPNEATEKESCRESFLPSSSDGRSTANALRETDVR
jgi:hypothetical protein